MDFEVTDKWEYLDLKLKVNLDLRINIIKKEYNNIRNKFIYLGGLNIE